MPLNAQQINDISTICPTVYQQGSPNYAEASAPWSIWADQRPQIAVEPTSLPQLQALIKYLYSDSTIDFCVRNTGTGGASASDVCVNMHKFKEFQWDTTAETVTLGAGLSWGEVDKLMDEKTDGYGCVGARCTWVGVAGSILVGGLSWLSHEHGMISDPQNLLDAQVLTFDGRVVWVAKEEPELMWALRGGGGNFGVVTALKFRAHRVSSKIFTGQILIPYSSLAHASRAVAAMHHRPSDPKVAMHIMNLGPGLGAPDQGSQPDIVIMPVDSHGETHARSDDGFAWAWNLPGAKEIVSGEMTLQQVNALADSFKSYQATNLFWLSAPLFDGSTVLLEFMQEKAFYSTASRTSTAWPHAGRRHVMQLVLGCPPDSQLPDGRPAKVHARALAMKRFKLAGEEIGKGTHHTGEYHAGFLHDWNDLNVVYGENLSDLRRVKAQYDPKNRFDKAVDLTVKKP